jgi:hypothetical protein
MSEPIIEQMNEAIALFMGMKGSGDYIRMNYNRYHCAWDALMPVGKRIRDLLSDMLSKRPPHTACMGDVIEVDITCALHEYDIKKVHEAVYVFIQWFNQQKEANNETH